jgi:capsular exopolysaccharide synthesis family protein
VDLRDCLRAIRRRWWLVAGTVVLALGAGWVASALTVPLYASSVTFFVSTPSRAVTDSYQGGLFSQQRVKSYADLLVGDRLARAVAADGEVGLTPPEIQARVSARAIPDTVLLQATVTDSDPERSERIAKSLATHFAALVATLETPAGGTTPSVTVDVVAGPLLNPVPVAPRPTRNLVLAGLFGLLFGAGLAVLRDVLDVTVKSADALREVAGAPVLAVVPFDAAARRAPLVMAGEPHSPRAEAFRHLRTNLQFVDVDRPIQVMVITSSVPDEGKSTTAVNLAIAFAEASRRVLLIEADLRRPKVAEYLDLEGAVGLSNVLAGQVDIDEVLQPWGEAGLRLLPSGSVPPNPSELLGSRNMAALLERLRLDFDVVVVDTPPLLPVTDAAVLARAADGVVVVTRSGKTPQARIRAALASLRAIDSRVLGCVLNMQKSRSEEGYYYYAYQMGGRRRSRKQLMVKPAPVRASGADVRVRAPR